MEFIITGFAVVLVCIWLFFVSVMAFDYFHWIWKIVAFVSWSLFIALMLASEDEANKEGPCVKTEVQMYYNAATKTPMPAEVCTLRGKWVEKE